MMKRVAAVLWIFQWARLLLPVRGFTCGAPTRIAEDGIVVLNVDCFSGDVSWTYNYDITRITIESLCGNDTQPTYILQLADIDKKGVSDPNLPLTEPGEACVYTACYQTFTDGFSVIQARDRPTCTPVLHRTTEVLPTTSEPLRPNTTNVLPTMSEQVLPDTQKVSPTTSKPVVQSSLLSSKLETSPNATPTKLAPGINVHIAITVPLATIIAVILALSVVALSFSVLALKRRYSSVGSDSDCNVNFTSEEALKGLDNLYTRGSEVTIPHALQLEDYEKEQTLFESNTFDEKLSDHIETSPEMSPSHLHEEIDNLSNNVPSLVSIIAFKPESKATTNFTKTDERESQSSGLITLSPMEDSSYHEMQYSPGVLHTSRCLSDSGATEHAEN